MGDGNVRQRQRVRVRLCLRYRGEALDGAENMSLRDDFLKQHPDFPLLSVSEPEPVSRFLEERRWLESGERVLRCEKAGEGNMNFTLRVVTDRRRVIVKQARPWVEKYPEIPAPWDRMSFEQRFYRRAASIPFVGECMPRLLASDAETRTILLEDLPGARDLTWVYERSGQIERSVLERLGRYLSALHDATRGGPLPDFENREMRALNHQHLFEVPLAAGNGLELERFEPGLEAAAARLKADRDYVQETRELGRRYLEEGACLVHGDYFPGSWLESRKGVYVIDPEFSFYGDPELDWGMACAHLALSGHEADRAAAFLDAADKESHLNGRLLAGYAGVEVMRRLIGVAQLPLPRTEGFRGTMLERSRRAVLEGEWNALWG